MKIEIKSVKDGEIIYTGDFQTELEAVREFLANRNPIEGVDFGWLNLRGLEAHKTARISKRNNLGNPS